MVVCDEAEDAIGRGTSQSTEWQARDEHREHCVARGSKAQRMKCVLQERGSRTARHMQWPSILVGSFKWNLWEWVSLVRSRDTIGRGLSQGA